MKPGFADAVATVGEPFTFGIDEGDVEAFVNGCGLALIADVGHGELTRRYLIRSDGSLDGRMTEFFKTAYVLVPDKREKDALLKKVYVTIRPKAAPASHTVEVPVDLQVFLDELMDSCLSKDMARVIDAFSKGYLNDGEGRETAHMSWLSPFYGRSFQAVKTARIVVTELEIKGKTGRLSGFIRSDAGLDLLPDDPVFVVKENGQWKLFGNQKSGPTDNR